MTRLRSLSEVDRDVLSFVVYLQGTCLSTRYRIILPMSFKGGLGYEKVAGQANLPPSFDHQFVSSIITVWINRVYD